MRDRKEYYKEYYRNNREKIKEYNKQYHLSNREIANKKNKQWYIDNPEWRKQYNKDNYERDKKKREQYRKDNPEKARESDRKQNLRHLYNLSHENWLKIYEKQDGKCAICGKTFDKPFKAFVDHSHKTDEIRGLLCLKCNSGIGYLNDDPELLAKAMKYLLNKNGEE